MFRGVIDIVAYTCIYIHTYICTYIYIYICIYTYIYTYIHAYIHTYMHTYKQTYIQTNIHTYVYTHTRPWRRRRPTASPGVVCLKVYGVLRCMISSLDLIDGRGLGCV